MQYGIMAEPADEQIVDAARGSVTSDAPSSDARATAVLAVLSGVSADRVAERFGINPGVLDRWVATFVDAGRDGLIAGAARDQDLHRDRYLSLVAHELRSPLTMIRGWAELLADTDVDSSDLLDRAIAGILTQTARLSRLADDALDATSVALGRLELDLQEVSLAESLAKIITARSLQQPELRVDDDSRVAIDLDRIGQVLDNLLENARRYAGTAPPVVVVSHRGAFAEITVTSYGEPIDPDLARRLFEPFERGAASSDGVGLGLYVCRSLVVAHGGQIGLRVDEEGNHFWVRLPKIEEDDMTYEFACGDVMPGCAATFDADSKEELFAKVAAHAKERHGLAEVSPEIARQVEDKITTS